MENSLPHLDHGYVNNREFGGVNVQGFTYNETWYIFNNPTDYHRLAMKILFDMFPIIIFFVAYKVSGNNMFVATGALMIATVLQMAYTWIKFRKLEKMHLITLVLVMVFGGLTLVLQDKGFIQWKVSIIHWLFGAVFLFSPMFSKTTLVERMMGSAISLPPRIWPRLNMAWAVFFAGVGFLNLYVMKSWSEEAWVDFKTFGLIGLTIGFLIIQFIYLSRHIELADESESEGEP